MSSKNSVKKITSIIRHISMNKPLSTFVPSSLPVLERDIDKLYSFITNSRRLFVLTGAGISTESGIPDYRSTDVGLYARTNHRPLKYQEFISSQAARQRFWARSFIAWPKFSSFQPNKSHVILNDWEERGLLKHLVTQNVDRLHTKAGSNKVIELHGCLYDVSCLKCHNKISRFEMQERLKNSNSEWLASLNLKVVIAPDGDVLLTPEQVHGFKELNCDRCNGMMKPDVIFFGETVPTDVISSTINSLNNSDNVLIIGSSLQVYSGYRFALLAKELGLKLAILNIGPTRANKIADLIINANCSDALFNLNL